MFLFGVSQKCSNFAPALLYFAERDSLVGVLLGNRVVLHIHDKRLLALLSYILEIWKIFMREKARLR